MTYHLALSGEEDEISVCKSQPQVRQAVGRQGRSPYWMAMMTMFSHHSTRLEGWKKSRMEARRGV
jgi:hypothetical protein